MPSCPSENELLELIVGTLPENRRREIQDHLDSCPSCPRLIAGAAIALTQSTPQLAPERGSEERPAVLAPQTRLGRYVVLELVGSGAMGAVYAAFDPELDRRVAIKLVRPEVSSRTPGLENRLLREGQAMAKLSHPNVVPIYDVGTSEHGVFMAMELVEGKTLRAWLRERSRPWRAVLAMFRDIGAGLAAAHRAGIIHRDFKPENVLVDAEGRPRVTDFGLARGVAPEGSPGGTPPQSPVWSLALTRTGAVLGTPAYMAPEQLAGGEIDARADCFAFCVALYEGLYGECPFPRSDLESLRKAVKSGAVRPAPKSSRVPPWLRRVVLRGLEPDPEARFATMEALLAALSADPARRLRRALLAGGAGALVLLTVLAVNTGREPACQGALSRLRQVWNEGVGQRIGEAFLRTGVPYAREVLATARRELDAYGRAWQAAHTEACEATRVRGEQSEALLDLRMSCLDQALVHLRALTEILAGADAHTVERAPQAIAGLPDLDVCANARDLGKRSPLPADPSLRARIQALQAQVGRVQALEQAGLVGKAVEEGQRALEGAKATGYEPLLAEAHLALARIHAQRQERAQEGASLHAALLDAERSGHDQVAFWAKLLMSDLVRKTSDDKRGSLRWVDYAEATYARIGGNRTLERLIVNARAMAYHQVGETDRAIPLFEKALALAGGEAADTPFAAVLLRNYSSALAMQGRVQDAFSPMSRALAIQTKALGAGHPDTLTTTLFVGQMLMDRGRLEEALAYEQEALAGREKLFGPENLQVATALIPLSNTLELLDRLDEAIAAQERALRIYEKRAGPPHFALLAAAGNLARIWGSAGNIPKSLAYAERAVAGATRRYGPDHVFTAGFRASLASALVAAGRHAEARAEAERSQRVVEKTFGKDHYYVALALYHLGGALAGLGQTRDALAAHERALRIRQKTYGPDNAETIESILAVAESYLAVREPERARALLEAALARPAEMAPSRGAALRFALARALAGTNRSRSRDLAGEALRLLGNAPRGAALRRRIGEWRRRHLVSR
jgi:tetratricopeptide (TPR) repeat protein/tRNA A-37 threonylcarbamoyl transferase component Bud32